jgi:uncharacterized protein YgbK (DUF1537 family)
MASPVWVVADDLTGAADAGVAFAEVGGPVRLLLTPVTARGRASGAVTVVDMATRELSELDARERTRALADRLGRDDVVFKKVDSILRGHIAAEVAELRDRLSDRLAVVAPAFPAAGRTTIGGVQHVHGTPLHLSSAWSFEPTHPPASLPALFASIPVTSLGLADVRSSTARLASLLQTAAADSRLVICDATRDQDLHAIVRAGRTVDQPILWVGSAGLAGALASELSDAQARIGPVDPTPATSRPPRDPQFLAVVGSASSLARRQALALAAEGARSLELPARVLARADNSALQELAAQVATAAAAGSTVVSVAGEAETRNAAAVCQGLATVTARAAAASDLVLLTGGATARAVLLRAGLTCLDILGELGPGVVLLTPTDQTRRLIVTKAGAFGDDQTLIQAVQRAYRRKERDERDTDHRGDDGRRRGGGA